MNVNVVKVMVMKLVRYCSEGQCGGDGGMEDGNGSGNIKTEHGRENDHGKGMKGKDKRAS